MNKLIFLALIGVCLSGCSSTTKIEKYHTTYTTNPEYSKELNLLIAAEKFEAQDVEAIIKAKLSVDRGKKADSIAGLGRLFSTVSLWKLTDGASISLLYFDGSREPRKQHFLSTAIIDTKPTLHWEDDIKNTTKQMVYSLDGQEGKLELNDNRYHSQRQVDYFHIVTKTPRWITYWGMQNFFTLDHDNNNYAVVKAVGGKDINTPAYQEKLKELTIDGRYVIYVPFVFDKQNNCTRIGFLYRNGQKVHVPEFKGLCEGA